MKIKEALIALDEKFNLRIEELWYNGKQVPRRKPDGSDRWKAAIDYADNNSNNEGTTKPSRTGSGSGSKDAQGNLFDRAGK